MTVRRINAIPPAGIPNHSLPLYALPTGDLVFSTNSLAILRGGITLANPAYVDKGSQPGTAGKQSGFRFTVRNPAGNPEATITDFDVEGDIRFFQAFNTVSSPVGITLAAEEEFEMCIFSSYGIDELEAGFNYLDGMWSIGSTFAGADPGEEELNRVFISYVVYVRGAFDNGKVPPLVPGRTSPNVYINEYEYRQDRENSSDISLRPND